MPSVLPSAEEAGQGQSTPEAAAADGRDAASNPDSRTDAPTGFAHQGANAQCAEGAWEQLLDHLRGAHAARTEGWRPECDAGVVEIQPADGVLLPQDHGKARAQVLADGMNPFYQHFWMVNTHDWIDVEYVLRKMLRCESSDCHHFHSTAYVFFRSCVMSHMLAESDDEDGFLLKPGALHRFPNTEVVIEVLNAHPRGIVEIGCYLEYVPG